MLKKLWGIVLTLGLLGAFAGNALAETSVTVGGEADLGYDFMATDYKGAKGANASDLTFKVNASISPTISFYGEIETKDLSKGNYHSDDAYAYLSFEYCNVVVGYYGFAFSTNKDIINNAILDFDSNVGIQLEKPFTKALSAKLYVPLRGVKGENDSELTQISNNQMLSEDNAFAVRLDYNKEKFGVGVMYGQTDWKLKKAYLDNGTYDTGKYDRATGYGLTLYYKPIKDLKLFLDNSELTAKLATGGSYDHDDNEILGLLYTPEKLPIEVRLEYDLDGKNEIDQWAFHPWGVRLDYKLNSHTQIEINRFKADPYYYESSVALNIYF